jgi:hypothetical protein
MYFFKVVVSIFLSLSLDHFANFAIATLSALASYTAMASLWGRYLTALDRNPFVMKSLTAGFLIAGGDLLAQTVIEPYTNGHRV